MGPQICGLNGNTVLMFLEAEHECIKINPSIVSTYVR